MKKIIKSLQKKNGFTLVELLVYFGLFSILLLVLSSIFITMLEQQTQTTSQSILQQESEYVLTKLKYEIYNADEIVSPNTPGTSSQSLTLRTDGEEQSFSLVNQQLINTIDTENWPMTTNEVVVSELEFENQSGVSEHRSIGVHLVIKSSLPQERNSYTREIDTTMTLR